jgi:hypothetical protein
MLVIIGRTQRLSTIFVAIFDSFRAAARRRSLQVKLGGCLAGILPLFVKSKSIDDGLILSTKTENIGDGCGRWSAAKL